MNAAVGEPAGVAMTDVFVALWWVQVGGAIWLAFVLELVYRRVYREPFLRYWALSFAALGSSLAWNLVWRRPNSTEVITSFGAYVAGLSQFALIALAALSLDLATRSLRRQMLLGAGIFAGLVALSVVTAWMVPGDVELRRTIRFERHLEGTVALAWFAFAFWRRHPLARTVGGRATVFFTVLYSVHHLLLALAVRGLPPYPAAYSNLTGIIAGIMPFCVSASLIVLASEATIATTKSLRDSEERYRTLVEASPDGIVATDAAGTILMCNRRAAEVHGYADAAGLIGSAATMLIAAADRERVRAAIHSTVTEGRPINLECQILQSESERAPR